MIKKYSYRKSEVTMQLSHILLKSNLISKSLLHTNKMMRTYGFILLSLNVNICMQTYSMCMCICATLCIKTKSPKGNKWEEREKKSTGGQTDNMSYYNIKIYCSNLISINSPKNHIWENPGKKVNKICHYSSSSEWQSSNT